MDTELEPDLQLEIADVLFVDIVGYSKLLINEQHESVRELNEIFRNTEIRDPELAGVSVTVTQVKPSPDMRHATVFVEPLGGQNAAGVLAALNRHRGYLRGELGRVIELKFTPELRFLEDTSFAEAERIATILHSDKVARDLGPEEDDDGAQA